jgi:hypothetical protein
MTVEAGFLHEPGTDLGDEMRRLLSLAETIQVSLDAASRRVAYWRTIQAAAVLVAVATAGVGLATSSSSSLRVSLLIAAVTVGATYAGMVNRLVQRAVMQADRDRRALSQVVDLLRETEGSFAKKEHWSTLERAEFRIRLSRFDV